MRLLLVLILLFNMHHSLACGTEDRTPPPPSRVVRVGKIATVVPCPEGRTAAVSPFGSKPYLFDIGRGEPKRGLDMPFDLPPGRRARCDAFSPDGSTLAGLGRDEHRNDFILVWDAATGNVLHQAMLPASAVYVMSLRFSPDGRVVYAGARTDLFQYNLATKQLTTLVPEVSYYVRDIAFHPDQTILGYIDGYHSFGLREWSVPGRRAVRARVQPPRVEGLRQLTSLDYSADGSEVAVAAFVQEDRRTSQFAIVRFDARTGQETGRLVVRDNVSTIRYVGTTRALVAWGPSDAGLQSTFGLIGPDNQMSDWQMSDWREVPASIAGVSIDGGDEGHLTIGLTNGMLLQWIREDWPAEWVALLRD